MATRKNRLQLLHGGLKRVQECGARYKVADDLRISAPPLNERACIHNNDVYVRNRRKETAGAEVAAGAFRRRRSSSSSRQRVVDLKGHKINHFLFYLFQEVP